MLTQKTFKWFMIISVMMVMTNCRFTDKIPSTSGKDNNIQNSEENSRLSCTMDIKKNAPLEQVTLVFTLTNLSSEDIRIYDTLTPFDRIPNQRFNVWKITGNNRIPLDYQGILASRKSESGNIITLKSQESKNVDYHLGANFILEYENQYEIELLRNYVFTPTQDTISVFCQPLSFQTQITPQK